MVVLASLAGCLNEVEEPTGGEDSGPADEPDAGGVAFTHSASGAATDPLALRGAAYPTGFDAVEPTIGIMSDGAMFMTAFRGVPTPFGEIDLDPTVIVSRDQGVTWTDTGPSLPTGNYLYNTFDPLVVVDKDTDRVFINDIMPVSCTVLSWSDDGGTSWLTNPDACGNRQVNDHQTLGASIPRLLTTVGYDKVLHLCFNNVGYVGCTASLDGGLTWRPQVPVYVEDENASNLCSGQTGHLRSNADGLVFLPASDCATGGRLPETSNRPVVYVSADDGLTWAKHIIADGPQILGTAHDVGIAFDEAGTMYATWIGVPGRVYMAHSQDDAMTWSEPIDVTPPEITATWYATAVAGAEGHLAFAYMGTDAEGGYENSALFSEASESSPNPEVWFPYIGIMTNATQSDVVHTVRGADHPFNRGPCGMTRCPGLYDFIGLDVDPDGRPWASFVDACLEECDTNPAVGQQGFGGILHAVTVSEGPSLHGGMLTPLAAEPL